MPRPHTTPGSSARRLPRSSSPPTEAFRGHAGCRAFTPELCTVAWPGKFKPDLPPHYDGIADPAEFLQLYELAIEAANGDEKVMANWFPMVLKYGARTWLLNLAPGTISSWDEMRTRFIANFQGTRDCPPAVGDLCRIKQQPGETLQKYIQCFNNARLKIPRVTEEAIISAFSDGVRDVKMKEELAIHEDLCTSLELFNLATKCARAKEGRLSLLELPATDPEEKKAKAKDVKRKGAAVLAAEPDTKWGRDQAEPSKDSRYCVYHDLYTHNTNECQELRAIREGRFGRRPQRNDRGYGRGGTWWRTLG